jgi:predicted amidohydrolase YtcJ
VSLELAHKSATTQMMDLAGRTLAPGFIDAHAHTLDFGYQSVGANLLASPDGTVNSIDELVARLQEFAKGSDAGRTGWIFGVGYDDTLLGRHPTRDDLDKVSKDVPVIAVHISGHFSAMNSAGLAKIGLTAASKDPEGCIIGRRDGSREPNGVLEEMASFPYMVPAVNPSKPEDKVYFLKRGFDLAKSFGFTTAYEERAFAFQHEQLVDAARRGLLDIDVVSQIDYSDRRVIPTPVTTTYDNRYRVAGIRITLDGSVPGRTAWLTQKYLIAPIGTALRMRMLVNSHSDAPVALPILMQVMWATVNRTSRSGKVIGADERLTPGEALKAITLWSAYKIFEEKTKDSIEPGKLADLVILSDNPLTIDPMKINTIVVLETIKEGKTVYTRL